MILTLLPSLALVKQAAQPSTILQGVQVAGFHSNRASITRIHRLKYVRSYPTLLVNPDGSTVTVPYHEPRSIIKLPFDITNLSEEEKKLQLEKRKPRTRVTFEDDAIDSSFDRRKYLKLLKK